MIKKIGRQNILLTKSDKPLVCVITPVHAVVKWNDQIYDANYNHPLYCSKKVLDSYTMPGTIAYNNATCYQFDPKVTNLTVQV